MSMADASSVLVVFAICNRLALTLIAGFLFSRAKRESSDLYQAMDEPTIWPFLGLMWSSPFIPYVITGKFGSTDAISPLTSSGFQLMRVQLVLELLAIPLLIISIILS